MKSLWISNKVKDGNVSVCAPESLRIEDIKFLKTQEGVLDPSGNASSMCKRGDKGRVVY